MSTPERADDPDEHGYGGVDKDLEEEDVPGTTDDEDGPVDDRRHIGGGGRGEGDRVDYPSR